MSGRGAYTNASMRGPPHQNCHVFQGFQGSPGQQGGNWGKKGKNKWKQAHQQDAGLRHHPYPSPLLQPEPAQVSTVAWLKACPLFSCAAVGGWLLYKVLTTREKSTSQGVPRGMGKGQGGQTVPPGNRAPPRTHPAFILPYGEAGLPPLGFFMGSAL